MEQPIPVSYTHLVGRYDGSYRYAPSKRWTFFPSVSAGWRLSEESFIKDNFPFITNLKISGSFGQSGYDAGDPFQYVSAYNSASNGYVFDGASQIMEMCIRDRCRRGNMLEGRTFDFQEHSV